MRTPPEGITRKDIKQKIDRNTLTDRPKIGGQGGINPAYALAKEKNIDYKIITDTLGNQRGIVIAKGGIEMDAFKWYRLQTSGGRRTTTQRNNTQQQTQNRTRYQRQLFG